MAIEKTYRRSTTEQIVSKMADIKQLVKFRLTLTVVFSSAMGYAFALQHTLNWGDFLLFMLGGFLVAGAANALNEIIEKDLDKLMKRTALRPLPAERMHVVEAILTAGIFSLSGIFILAWFFNPLTGLIAAASMLIYAFIYTPLKRISNFAVFVGAIPGALPPVIGWVSITGHFGLEAMLLFSIQFLWQFPHFWAIAWLSFDDYKKAGFNLLPTDTGKSKNSAVYNMIYIATLIPVSMLPWIFGLSGELSLILVLAAGFTFLWLAVKLFLNLTESAARNLLFGSLIYLPLVLLALILDKI